MTWNARRLGVGVYPDYTGMDEIKAYLISAKKLGFGYVFTSLLLGDLGYAGSNRDSFEAFRELGKFCAWNELHLCADVDERTFARLKATPSDLSVFKELGLNTLRVDGGFSPKELIMMSSNTLGLDLAINASAAFMAGPDSVNLLLELLNATTAHGNLENLAACHNFFPLPETGLDMEFANKLNAVFHERGVRVGGFVASQTAPPMIYTEGCGLPSIEAQRYLPPHLSAAELFAAGFAGVIIGDYPASTEEMRRVVRSAESPLDIPVVFDSGVDRGAIEKLLATPLRARLDQPESIIRAANSRGIAVKPYRTGHRPAYTVTLCNERAGRYMGEVQISLRDLCPSHNHNVIGFIHPDARRLATYLKGGAFEFVLSEYGK